MLKAVGRMNIACHILYRDGLMAPASVGVPVL